MKACITVLSASLLLVFPAASSAADPAPATATASPEQQVDALFAKWNKPDAPGCAVAIIRDGKVVLRKGYGMADIERGAPITSQTVFNVGSMSKQFTAFSIHLLAQDGKLTLDDDIRIFLPEMPDYGKTITIRHLLQHTSGLRDVLNLAMMGGWRLDDNITREDLLGLLQRQRALNFAPGQEYLYSNSGYTLLAEIVQRVSGKPLRVFAKERIFDPLGMKHTVFQTDYGTLVAGRALSYVPAGGGYKYQAVGESSAGPGGLLTTVEDLALWDQNFYDGRVGGKDLIAKMQLTGTLNSGRPINYASGLMMETYRGAKIVEHGGAIGGYQSQMSRFPEQHFTVTVLANSPDLAPTAMARRIADIYLESTLAPKPAVAAAVEVKLDPEKLAPLVGYYALSPAFGINFTLENGQLFAQATGQAKFPVFASGEREFFYRVVNAQLSFDAPGADGVVQRVVLHQNGAHQPGTRTRKLGLAATALQQYEGEYYSDELHVLYTVARKDGALVMTYPRGAVPLEYASGNNFTAPFPVGRVMFECTTQGGCSGFKVDGGRVRNLQFRKVPLTGTAGASS